MKISSLANNVSAAAVAAQAAVDCDATPFLPGRKAILDLDLFGVTGSPVIKVQGSNDGSTWTDLVSHTALVRSLYEVEVYAEMRANVTTAGTAGTFSATLIG